MSPLKSAGNSRIAAVGALLGFAAFCFAEFYSNGSHSELAPLRAMFCMSLCASLAVALWGK